MKAQSTKLLEMKNTASNIAILKSAGYREIPSFPRGVYFYILINRFTKMFRRGRTSTSYIELKTEEITSKESYDTHEASTLLISQNRKRL